jgi:hypothetical protein
MSVILWKVVAAIHLKKYPNNFLATKFLSKSPFFTFSFLRKEPLTMQMFS